MSRPSRVVEVRALLDSPHLASGHRVRSVLAAALRRGARLHPDGPPQPWRYWNPEHFGLHQSRLFRAMGPESQRRVLDSCALTLLAESYFIEKLGLSFTAKMTLLSETTEERMLYSLFAADEASHLSQVAVFIPGGGAALLPDNPFLRLLSETVELGSRPSLTYLIQVVLEGWGISHYQGIAHDCQVEPLARALKFIVKDEALHHGSGVALAQNQERSEADRAFILEVLSSLFQMVQAGPQAVVDSLEREAGHLSRGQRIELFRELDCQAHSIPRLGLLRTLIAAADAVSLMERLERHDAFRPFTPEECANLGRPSILPCAKLEPAGA